MIRTPTYTCTCTSQNCFHRQWLLLNLYIHVLYVFLVNEPYMYMYICAYVYLCNNILVIISIKKIYSKDVLSSNL